MQEFKISDSAIEAEKKKRISFFVSISIAIFIFLSIISYFSIAVIMDRLAVYIFVLLSSFVLIFVTVFLVLRFQLKALTREMKNTMYIIENDTIKVIKNNFEQFNVPKNMIYSIDRYKDNVIIIRLNDSRRIVIENNISNYDQFIMALNILSPLNAIDKNTKKTKRIISEIVQIIILYMFFISNNFIFIFITGSIILIHPIVQFFDETVDKKRRVILLIVVIILILVRIVQLL